MQLRVRDPVHGLIHYTDQEAAIIDSRPLQRLRGIKQLAMTNLVYPGATHTRFEHSLGVMHLAGRMAERVGFTRGSREWRLVRLAGLLHDTGHPPFSHAGEAAMAALSPQLAERGEEAHEHITSALLQRDTAIRAAIPDGADREAVLSIILKGQRSAQLGLEHVLWQIISHPFDADKLDYLIRDSYMTGVKYGIFDLERLLDSVRTVYPQGERQLALSGDALYCVEQLVIARYYITEQVYRHRVRRITDAMLKQAVLAAKGVEHDAARTIERLFTFTPDDDGWLDGFLRSSDEAVLSLLTVVPPNTKCGKLASRLYARRLLKQVFECSIDRIPRSGHRWRRKLVGDLVTQDTLSRRLANRLGLDPDQVLLDVRKVGNPLYRDPALPVVSQIILIDDDGKDEPLEDVEGSLSQKVKVEDEAKLYLYVPADGTSKEERARMAREIEAELGAAAEETRT